MFKKDINKLNCIYFNVNIKKWNYILSFINNDDLYIENNKFGKEYNPHVTLLYGIFNNIINNIKTLLFLKKLIPLKIYIDDVSYFEHNDYYVLIYKIKSKYLLYLRDNVLKTLSNIQTFKEYNPHITIAFLKKDVDINKYLCVFKSRLNYIEYELLIDEVIYSKYNGKKLYLNLKKN